MRIVFADDFATNMETSINRQLWFLAQIGTVAVHDARSIRWYGNGSL